ncbi:MAG: hypothetical protein HEQ10_23195 [Dolichospermum sp. DEX182a]|nr:hypothetical protein [Dolichospermum sp. DEX182a]
MNQQQFKSLLPYDEDYVLIHKSTLIINNACLGATSELLAKHMNLTPDQVSAMFAVSVSQIFMKMTPKQVSDCANSIVANCLKANQQQLVVTTDFTPPDEAV